MASDFTPSRVRTARRNWISAVALATMVLNVVESMETRIVRKSWEGCQCGTFEDV